QPGARADLPGLLLRDDRAARRPPDGRHRHRVVPGLDGVARGLLAGVLRAGGDVGALLALRGHRLDLPAAAALPDRHALLLGPALLSEVVMAERIIPRSTYYGVFAALIALTVLTVLLSFLHLGNWHTVVGLIIAAAKALLVALFFMHLIHSGRVTWVVIAAG